MKYHAGIQGSSRARHPEPAKGKDPALRRSSPWHCVSVVAKGACCNHARALRAARFLSAQAPRLPLPQCPAPDRCPCAYKHHADRRSQPRRKDEITGLRQAAKVPQERRVERTRRRSD